MTAASVIIEAWYGTTPSYADVTSGTGAIRYQNSDTPSTIDTNNPISVPDGGAGNYAYSYWITLGLKISNINDAEEISNIDFYSDGTLGWDLGTGGCINVLQKASSPHGITSGEYEQATGAYALDDGTNGHDACNSVTNLYTTYTSGDTMDVDTSTYTATNDRTYAVVVQAKVDGDAPAGTQTGETLTFTYDEI